MSVLDTEVDSSNPASVCCVLEQDTVHVASVDSAVKCVPDGFNLVNGVQCYDLFGGIALKNRAFFK